MPDGNVIPLGGYECRAASARYIGERETHIELVSDAKDRCVSAYEEFRDALDELEREAGVSMRLERAMLEDAIEGVRGVRA